MFDRLNEWIVLVPKNLLSNLLEYNETLNLIFRDTLLNQFENLFFHYFLFAFNLWVSPQFA
jgi:hypothetical protein